MTDAPDAWLLDQFARNGSEEAFAVLVNRHIGVVHSVALRHTANPQYAEDITQAVFIILARKAGTLGRKAVLPGWLYQTARADGGQPGAVGMAPHPSRTRGVYAIHTRRCPH
jgi:hypothetical protein